MHLDRKFKLTLIILLVSFGFAGVAFSEEFGAFTGKVKANNINLRVDATTSASVVCALDKGQLVEVVGEAYDWYKIRLPKTAPSYIKKQLVECINRDTSLPEQTKCLNAKVTGNRVNIRFGPDETSWILGKVDKLTVVNILADKGSWYKIEPVEQSYGWVNKKFVDKGLSSPKEEVPVPLVKEAKSSDQLILEGTVSPYGMVLWRTATHKLVTSDNKIYFLKGNRKGLDSLNHHKVKVTGKLISPANSKSPIIQVAIIEALN